MPDYSLVQGGEEARMQARRWLLLGVAALGVGGIFAGLLSRDKSDFFYTALTVHVDLTVLVWFLTMAAMLFALAAHGRGLKLMETAAFYSFAGGTALIALSAFSGGEAYMSNYIPVIHHPVFFLGLGLLFCGIALAAMNLLIAAYGNKERNAQHFGVAGAACILLIALACFVHSVRSLHAAMTGQIFYEYAFWDGGHVLQFVHTQLMMVCWLWLAGAAGMRIRRAQWLMPVLYSIGLLAALYAPFIDLQYDVISDENRDAFTTLMRHMNGIAPLMLGVAILFFLVFPAKGGICANPPACAGVTALSAETTLPRICLVMSILLFTVGGSLGYLIKGSNLVVPAHYHGSIIGITLAFMGVAYLMLPQFGWRDVSRSKLTLAQPVIYGGGQLCWMAGMALLGEHGVPRKTPGSADTVNGLLSALKHASDGLALIGGLLFVFIVLRAVFKHSKI